MGIKQSVAALFMRMKEATEGKAVGLGLDTDLQFAAIKKILGIKIVSDVQEGSGYVFKILMVECMPVIGWNHFNSCFTSATWVEVGCEGGDGTNYCQVTDKTSINERLNDPKSVGSLIETATWLIEISNLHPQAE